MAETNTKIIAPTKERGAFPGSSAAPTQKRRSRGAVSEYKKSLQEKQALRNLYGLSEKKFKKYVLDALSKIQKVTNVSDELVKVLEKRLDNVVFRLGFAKTRAQARQLVNHSYFLINGKSVNIPSFQVGKGDVIEIKEGKKKKLIFQDLKKKKKKTETPSWLKLNKDSFKADVSGEPSLAEVNPPVEISLIFEFYSK